MLFYHFPHALLNSHRYLSFALYLTTCNSVFLSCSPPLSFPHHFYVFLQVTQVHFPAANVPISFHCTTTDLTRLPSIEVGSLVSIAGLRRWGGLGDHPCVGTATHIYPTQPHHLPGTSQSWARGIGLFSNCQIHAEKNTSKNSKQDTVIGSQMKRNHWKNIMKPNYDATNKNVKNLRFYHASLPFPA